MPSWAAIAAAVVAWSPVIMRTRMPASLQRAIASFASLRGGSTMRDQREQRQALHLRRAGRRSRSNATGRCRACATASTRSPSPASRSFSASTCSRPSSAGTSAPSAPRIDDERASRTSGAPLTKQRDDAVDLVEGRHELVLGVERHLGDARVDAPRLVDVEPALGGRARRARASVGSPTISPSRTAASLRERHRQQERLERPCRCRRRRAGSSPRSSSPRPRPSSGGRRPRAAARSSG